MRISFNRIGAAGLGLGLGVLLAACSIAQLVVPSNLALGEPDAEAEFTASASPSPQPSFTPSATPTASPTPTPTLHPLSIEWLRSLEFPASEVSVEDSLDSGANYSRYLASYRSEGLKIYALLTVPFGEMPDSGWPVVIFNHGFIPPDEYRTTERYIAYVDGFARNGYIVFRSDYRGHADSEGVARGGYGSPDYTIDVLNAVAAMKVFPQADPARIGMWGHSMGGYITLRSLVVSEDIRAGVIWAGVVASYPDLLTRWRRPATGGLPPTPRPGSWRGSLAEMFGSPEENPSFWASISANSYLADLSGPVQLHHGTADTSVPLEFSATLYEQILEVGGTVEYYEYPDDNHNLANYFTTAMQRSIQFFDRYVKGPPG
jgi:dipeptidyl aminopeptidase/acylaminoacyl peptidase